MKKKTNHHDGRNSHTTNGNEVILRLRPNVTKEERRTIHHLICQQCRLFETSTISDFPLTEGHHHESQITRQSSNEEKRLDNSEVATAASVTTCAAILVRWSKRTKKGKKRRRSHNQESDKSLSTTDPYPNILCVLKKRQKEHLTTIHHLSAALRCRASDIGLAGIKDMQAVTYQYCTLRGMQPERVVSANRLLRDKGIELDTRNLFKVDWILSNGQLDGNYFEIILRNVARVQVVANTTHSADSSFSHVKEILIPCNKSHIQDMVNRVRSSGFINFYGEQRLGVPGLSEDVGVRAFDIGKAMLQKDFALAVDLVLTGRSAMGYAGGEGENDNARRVYETWKTSGGDVGATIKCLPKGDSMPRERAILKGLKRYGKDKPLAALQCLQYSMRIFWINAYQSFIWNTVATERIKRYGLKVIPGDLYQEEGATEMKVVDQSNSSNISLNQVVLPLPGYNVQYPKNEIGSLYQSLLHQDGIQLEKGAPDEATAKGSYRHLIVSPQNLNVTYFEGDGSDGFNTIESLKLSFELPKGCYATMLLRELMLTTATRPNL